MSEASDLQTQIGQRRSGTSVARQRIACAQAQIASLEEAMRRLQEELAGLEGFRDEARRDLETIGAQIDERKAALAPLDSMANVRAAATLSQRLREHLDRATRRDVDGAGRDVLLQVSRAIVDVQDEIASLRAQVSSLEQAMAQDRHIISQNDAAVARLEAQVRALG